MLNDDYLEALSPPLASLSLDLLYLYIFDRFIVHFCDFFLAGNTSFSYLLQQIEYFQ